MNGAEKIFFRPERTRTFFIVDPALKRWAIVTALYE